MVRKTLLVLLLVGSLILSWSSSGFASYSIDGLLSDWGVTPFSDWVPSSSTADYTEADWTQPPAYPGYIGTGGEPAGGEVCDIEALFFDDDPGSLYFALVTSYAFLDPGSHNVKFGFGSSGAYDYAVQTQGLGPADYGHSFVPLTKLGSDIGLAEIYYWNATDGGGPYIEPGTDIPTWVLEGKMDRLLFDSLASQGNYVRLMNTMECKNDRIALKGDIDTVIPEPASMFLLGMSLLGLAGLTKRKVRSTP